jgi:single-stranded-DNA-specific exonuclease
MELLNRKTEPSDIEHLISEGVNPVIAQCWSGRGIKSVAEVCGHSLQDLIPYTQLTGAVEMALILRDAIVKKQKLLIVADYDADGATACSVGLLGLRALGADVSYIIPDRQIHGYGLTPTVVDLAMKHMPDYLITVDNGIAAHAGISYANEKGIPVLVTDHHLPGETHPDARVIVNPSQHGCLFPSKHMAGCGVIWYVLWALQNVMIEEGLLDLDFNFDISSLLPIVAVGTIADVVSLDYNNRTLVNLGLRMIREGKGPHGIDALSKIAKRNPEVLATSDIAFGVAPRINAAGRLESMDAGVECLTSLTEVTALSLAQELDKINSDRKERETTMSEQAITQLVKDVKEDRKSIALYSDDWHIGIIGIVAGRLKEKHWRPTFVLAKGSDESKANEIKGSGRSIPGFHLRDALVWIDTKYPDILLKFGGHAMAAGVTVRASMLEAFQDAFEEVAQLWLTDDALQQKIDTDGPLAVEHMTLETVAQIRQEVWGQGFPAPVFHDVFEIEKAQMIGKDKKTLKLYLRKGDKVFEAVKFKHTDGIPIGHVDVLYKLDVNDYNGNRSLQLMVEHLETCDAV